MSLLFDQNLSHRLPPLLAAKFPGSKHVREVGLGAAADQDIWDYALTNGFAIVSKDSDFFHRSLLFGHPPKVIWLQVGNSPTANVLALLRTRHSDILAFLADSVGTCLVLP